MTQDAGPSSHARCVSQPVATCTPEPTRGNYTGKSTIKPDDDIRTEFIKPSMSSARLSCLRIIGVTT